MNERIIDLILYLASQIRKKTPMDSIDVKVLSADGYTDAEIGAKEFSFKSTFVNFPKWENQFLDKKQAKS